MNKGWLELESDPGVFTLLVEDFGVEGIQVEEIYDLGKPIEGPVYGFIFLFRWTEDRRSRRKPQEDESFVVEDKIINSMFFAHQVISNSCATHALLSVLLNCEHQIKLGDMLTRLKNFTKDMTPENKGISISNMPDLARAHNSHARPEPCRLPEKQQGISSGRIQEAFHFVSYVLINGHLFELDGLKPYPIDHGPLGENEDLTSKFFRVISERLGMAAGGEPSNDIRYALMAVVPDRRLQYEQKLTMLKTNRNTIVEALQQIGLELAGKRCRSSQRLATEAHNRQQQQQLESGDDGGLNISETASSSSLNQSDVGRCGDHVGSLSASHSRHLTVQTSFTGSPVPVAGPLSDGSTTDTASEVASLLHSPGELSVSSNGDSLADTRALKSELGDDLTTAGDESKGDLDSRLAEAARALNASKVDAAAKLDNTQSSSAGSVDGDAGKADRQDRNSSPRPHFTAKELQRLLKRVDEEIKSCEMSHREEIEKRNKYKIDDCRRTHNYDQFITTFLQMLAEQGQLASLVEQHMVTKRRQGFNVGRLHKIRKTVAKKKRIRHKR